MTPRHKRARELASAGYKIFPCIVNGKQPATKNGFKDATTDLAQIDAWWAEADYNIGMVPEDAGYCVIDLDPGAEEHWIALLKKHGAHPVTYEVITPRNGRHLYFSGSLPASTSKLGPHIDTRGRGSYVLVPPSVIDGKEYRTVDHGRDVAACPSWIETGLTERDHRVSTGSPKELDLATSLVRARGDLFNRGSRGDVAFEGFGGDNRTYQTALDIRDYGISEEMCVRLLLEKPALGGKSWNELCDPPWSEEALRQKVHNAYTYAQNKEAGAWAVRPLTEAFAHALPPADGEPVKASRFTPRRMVDFRNQPAPEWIVPDMIPARSTVLLYAPSGSYKSFLALDIFLRECAKGSVGYYVAGEGLYGIETDRSRAWQIANNVDDETLMHTFRTATPPALGMPGDGTQFIEALVADGQKPRLIVFDTSAGIMAGLDINKPGDVSILTRFCAGLIEAFDCTVIVVHHVSDKPGARERGPAGSYAWTANFDVALEMNAIEGEMRAVECWVRKMKDAPERGKPWTYKMVPLGKSLAIREASSKEHAQAREDAMKFTAKKVARALRERDCVGLQRGLTTAQMAVELCGAEAMDDKRVHRELEKLARKELRMYCEKVDGVLWWYLDHVEADRA